MDAHPLDQGGRIEIGVARGGERQAEQEPERVPAGFRREDEAGHTANKCLPGPSVNLDFVKEMGNQ